MQVGKIKCWFEKIAKLCFFSIFGWQPRRSGGGPSRPPGTYLVICGKVEDTTRGGPAERAGSLGTVRVGDPSAAVVVSGPHPSHLPRRGSWTKLAMLKDYQQVIMIQGKVDSPQC